MSTAEPEFDEARRTYLETRPTPEVIALALSEPDENKTWDAIWVLRYRGTREVFDAAARLCRGNSPDEQALGADILGQLAAPELSFRAESVPVLAELLNRAQEPAVLKSAAYSLGHLRHPDGVAPLLRHVAHPSEIVRHAVAFGLAGQDDERAIAGLIALSADNDAEVRDWATFGLGQQTDVDTPALRSALLARLGDSDDDTRAEAFVGLARRRDGRVVAPLLRELLKQEVGSLIFEAAAELADARLLPLLLEWQKRLPGDPEIERALACCRDGGGPS